MTGSDRWEAWDRFLEATDATGFMQSSWWAEFRAVSGYRCFGVTLKDGAAIVGGAMVMKWSFAPDKCFYSVSEGPVLPEGDDSLAGAVFDSVLATLEKHRAAERQTVSHLRIEPRWRRLPGFVQGFEALALADAFTEPRNTLCVDLRPPLEDILAQMKPKGRYNVRVARRHGVTVSEDCSAQGLADFVRIHGATARRKDIDAKSPGYFSRLLSMLSFRRRISILFAEHRGRRLATALVVYFGRRATYLFGGSLAEDRHLMAPYLLQFESLRRAKARGCECYDFWGVAPPGGTGSSWHALSVFKRKFGGHELRLVPTLDRVFDRAAYADYVSYSAFWSERTAPIHGARRECETILV